MPDIFISYSSHDREQAELLTELLTSTGLSVWIDKSSIGAATSWSKEIVDAIDECKAMVVLLSPSSIESANVVKEISLASERKKKILPLDLEPVTIPNELAYHLAGIQRTAMTNIDAIIRALSKLGLEATGAPQAPKIVKETDARKSLMILPFEDLSPTGDNAWFADGIVSELISALSNVKALNVTDAQTTKDFKRYQGTLPNYAREMQIRYFVEGDVRKFGDNIKITARLLDIETGDHLWQDTIKGVMQDVFEIQEAVASKVLAGLEVHLSKEERSKLQERGTVNQEAWELWLKGLEYMNRETVAAHQHAVTCLEQAIQLDPKFGRAHGHLAQILLMLFNQTGDAVYLQRAEHAVEIARELYGGNERFDWVYTHLLLAQNDIAGALASAQRAIAKAPNYGGGYHALGSVYQKTGDIEGEIAAWEKFVRLGDERGGHESLLYALRRGGAKYTDELQHAAERAIPVFKRHTRLNPDDFRIRIRFAVVLVDAGRPREAIAEASSLPAESLNAETTYDLACMYAQARALDEAIAALRRAFQKGFSRRELLATDPDLDRIRQTPEFEELVKELESDNA